MKKKSKTKEFLEDVGFSLYIIWMLILFLPVLIYEGIEEFLEKRRKAKELKPGTVKFVCSECGETFTPEKLDKKLQLRGNDGEEHSYFEPLECPKCLSMRTRPEGRDISLYEKIWEMNELRSFFWDMKQEWLQSPDVDHGLREYRCSECGTVFEARDIGHYRMRHPFPSRCHHCHHTKTMPTSEENQRDYEPVWRMLETAEQTKKARKTKRILKIITLSDDF